MLGVGVFFFYVFADCRVMTILLAVRDFPDGCGAFPKFVEDIKNKNDQHLARRYLPPRKASAVRDFLPLFGACNDMDVCQEEGKKVGLQNLAVDDNNQLKKVSAADDVKEEVKSNIQDDYSRKRNIVDFYQNQTDSERNVTEGLKELRAFEEPSSQMKMAPEKKLQVSSSDMKVVLGFMVKSECPWRSGQVSSHFKLGDAKNEDKRKKVVSFALPDRSRRAIKTKCNFGQKPFKKKANSASEGMGELEIWGKEGWLDPVENSEESHEFDVNVTPSSHSNFTGGDESDSDVTREKVREALRLFQVVCRSLLEEGESKSNELGKRKRVDLIAARILKDNGIHVNSGKKILGPVPGVEVGDEFQYRVELNIIGLHLQIQGGIDYVKHNGKILATSIVASGGYADYLVNSDVLVYSGQGGNVMSNDKKPEDQKLKRGNLALKNSSEEKNPVRVIRGSESMDDKYKTYVYDGLYVVESYWQDRGSHGKLVYRFRLKRIPGQKLALKEVKKSK
ncbi:hypothetical protein GLYMA_11G040100v4 [Glycine max]|nr:hypothetical protein GLYMA_11G040100v4 [Glycine max]KAH1157505.1 hypothetical protein GYH30_029966 [Glycine max]